MRREFLEGLISVGGDEEGDSVGAWLFEGGSLAGGGVAVTGLYIRCHMDVMNLVDRPEGTIAIL